MANMHNEKKPLPEKNENQVIEASLSDVSAMLEDIPACCHLHLKSLKAAKKEGNVNCYLWDQGSLYYIEEDGSSLLVPLTEPQKLTDLFDAELNTLELSGEQIQEAITNNGGNITVFRAKNEKNKPLPVLLQRIINYSSLFSRGLANNGNNIFKLIIALGHAARSIKNTQLGFKASGLIPALIDFFEWPLLLLTALILRKKLPINLSGIARWFIAVGGLALVLVSIIIPSISTAITLAISAYLLMVGCLNFIELSYNFYQTTVSLEVTDARFHELQQSLGEKREKAYELRAQLEFLLASPIQQDESIAEILNEINKLKTQYDQIKKELQPLAELRKNLDNQKNTMSTQTFLNQMLILSFRILAVIGAALVFCTPVIGNSLLVSSGLLITAVLLVPILYTFSVSIVHWMKKKIQGDNTTSDENDPGINDNSTAYIISGLPQLNNNELSAAHSELNDEANHQNLFYDWPIQKPEAPEIIIDEINNSLTI